MANSLKRLCPFQCCENVQEISQINFTSDTTGVEEISEHHRVLSLEETIESYKNGREFMDLFKKDIIEMEIDEYTDSIGITATCELNQYIYLIMPIKDDHCVRNLCEYWSSRLINLKRLEEFKFYPNRSIDVKLVLPMSIKHLFTEVIIKDITIGNINIRERLKSNRFSYQILLNCKYYKKELKHECEEKYEKNNKYYTIIVTSENYDKILNNELD